MKLHLILILSIVQAAILFAANGVSIKSFQGEVFVRHGVENTWRPITQPGILPENACLRTIGNSSAEIQLPGGEIFRLAPNSIVDAAELKSYTSSELLLILTSLEIADLPVKPTKPAQPSGAFVIHGQQSQSMNDNNDSAQLSRYFEYESNGLNALFEQSLWSGVVLKIFKLKKSERTVDIEELHYKLIVAYFKLNFVSRFEQEKKQFMQSFPKSALIAEINRLK